MPRNEPQVDDITDIAWPTGAIVKMEFPDIKGHGDVTLTWYEGKKPDGTQYAVVMDFGLAKEPVARRDLKKADGEISDAT